MLKLMCDVRKKWKIIISIQLGLVPIDDKMRELGQDGINTNRFYSWTSQIDEMRELIRLFVKPDYWAKIFKPKLRVTHWFLLITLSVSLCVGWS